MFITVGTLLVGVLFFLMVSGFAIVWRIENKKLKAFLSKTASDIETRKKDVEMKLKECAEKQEQSNKMATQAQTLRQKANEELAIANILVSGLPAVPKTESNKILFN